MKVDPNAPAYPVFAMYHGADGNLHPMASQFVGMPIRLAIAAQIMAGMIRDRSTSTPNSFFAGISLEWADALIAAHNEGAE